MKAKLSLKSLKVSGRFTKTLEDVLETQIRQAARAWLREVITHVPVYTGMARGSLIPLGQFLRVAIPINRNPSADEHGYSWRSQAQGISLGHFSFTRTKTTIQFHFSTSVPHFIINELFDVSDTIHLIEPTPWHSFEFGKDAFFNYLNSNLPQKLPKLSKYIEASDLYI
jgi:hypothetical protein